MSLHDRNWFERFLTWLFPRTAARRDAELDLLDAHIAIVKDQIEKLKRARAR